MNTEHFNLVIKDMKKKIKIKAFNPSKLIQPESWEDKLVDLIEKEIELASGKKSKEHFSGSCVMNNILELVQRKITESIQEGYNRGRLKCLEQHYGKELKKDNHSEVCEGDEIDLSIALSKKH